MLSVIHYLNNLQIGGRSNESLPPKARVNMDEQLLRLENRGRDQLRTYHRQQDGPPFMIKFRKDAKLDLLAVANEVGEIVIVDTEKSKVLRSFIAHKNAIFDISWLPDKNFLMTAAGDFTAKLFDMITCECVSTFSGHTGSIKTIDVCPVDSNIFATGTRDGCIGLWDRRDTCRKPYSKITDAHPRKNISKFQKQSLSGISCITFQDGIHLVSAGVADGAIKVWDLRRTYVSNHKYSPWKTMEYCSERIYANGCSSLKFDSTRTRLYAYLTSNSVRRFDCLSYTEDEEIYIGMRCRSYFLGMDLSYDDQYLLCGSLDGRAYVWNTSKPGPPLLALPGNNPVEVGSVAWCPYSITKLVTASDDNKLRIWRVKISEDKRDDKRYFFEPKATTEGCLSTDTTDLKSLRERFTQVKPPASGHWQPSPQTPVSKPITNYYSPMTPQPCLPSSSSLESAEASSPSTERTPCQVVTPNGFTCVTPSSSTESPQGGKENTLSPESDGPSRGAQASRGQVKRKKPKASIHCRYHPEGCERVNGPGCGKKVKCPPDNQPSIKGFLTPP